MKQFYAALFALCVLVGTAHAFPTQPLPFDTSFETCAVGTGSDFPCEGWVDIVSGVTEGLGETYASIPLNQRSGPEAQHNKIEITNTTAFSGSKSVKTTFVANQTPVGGSGISCAYQNPTLYTYFSPQDFIFTRSLIRKSPGFIISSNNTTKMYRFTSAGAYPTLSVWMNNQKYTVSIEGGYRMGTVLYQGGPTVSSTSWDQVETEWRMNTPGQANGLVRLWVNGILYIEKLNLELRGPTSTSVPAASTAKFSNAQIFVQCGIGNMYWDRMAVGTTRFGLIGGTPPPVDTVPPSVPSGLAINGNVLTWAASTDGGNPASGVSNYEIAQCGPTPFPCTPTIVVGTSVATNYTANLIPGQPYSFRVRANDNAGNQPSAFSTQVNLSAAPSTNRNIGFPADAFTRADNTDAGPNWIGGYTAQDILGVTSNTLQAPSTSLGLEGISSYAAPNNQWVKGTLVTWGSGTKEAALCVRLSTPATWNSYCGKLRSSSPFFSIEERTAGTGATLISRDDLTPAQGDTYYVQVEGSTIKFIRLSGTTEILLLSIDDATLASGRVGAYLSNATVGQARWDDVSAGGFGSASAGTIAVDAISSSPAGNITNTTTWNHTVGASGANRALAVCTAARDSVVGDVAVVSVTAGGVPLTKIRNDTAAGTFLSTELWSMIAPSVGVLPIVVTWSQPLSSYGVASAISMTGVDQLSPNDANGGATGTSATIAGSITTVADNALIVDCALAQASALTITGGQTAGVNRTTTGTADDTGLSTFTQPTAGAKTVSYSQNAAQVFAISAGSFKPATVLPAVQPKILSMIATPAGMTITYSGDLAKVRVDRGTNSGSVIFQDTYDIALFTAGVLLRSWEAGLHYIGAHGIGFDGIENLIDYRYGNNATGTSQGFSAVIRQTAPVLSNPQPANTLPAGTTSRTISLTYDVATECRYLIGTGNPTADAAVTFDEMSLAMAVSSLSASVTATGLTNGSTALYYVRCKYINELLEEYTNTASSVITVQVASVAGDTTLPSTITTGLICDSHGLCSWPIATDNVAIRWYEIRLSDDGCATFNFTAQPPTNSYQFQSLANSKAYCAVVRAEDTTGNLSLNDSNQATFTTPALIDVIQPDRMTGLRAIETFTNSVRLGFDPPTSSDVISATIQSCQGVGCTDFSNTRSTQNGTQTIVSVDLVAGTVNRFRGYFFDGTLNSEFSDIINVTTETVGLGTGRPQPPAGVQRSVPTGSGAVTRPGRP